MTILWCGGEDVDFISSGMYKSGRNYPDFSRYSLTTYNYVYRSELPFSETVLTSIWLGVVLTVNSDHTLRIGVTDENKKGIYFGNAASALGVFSYDGSSWGTITTNAVGLRVDGTPARYAINFQNYGTNSTINIYKDGILVHTYTGACSVSGVVGFNYISMFGSGSESSLSEIIIADEDTRLMRLKTHAPNAAGDSSTNWTGAYTDIDEEIISDADKIYSSTNNSDFQCNLTGMPSGTWSVKAVKVAARCVDGSGRTGIQLGVKSGGTVDSGDTQTASGYWQTKERLMTVNPVTGVAFTPAEIEALQINLRAVTL